MKARHESFKLLKQGIVSSIYQETDSKKNISYHLFVNDIFFLTSASFSYVEGLYYNYENCKRQRIDSNKFKLKNS